MNTAVAESRKAAATPAVAKIDTKLEGLILPVSDVDRAKNFYVGLGWRLDADFSGGDDWRIVQVTPPGSEAAVLFGKGVNSAEPGSVKGTFLVVSDIDAARKAVIAGGADVSEVFHFDQKQIRVTGTQGRLPGPDPERGSYTSFASFADPDGNTWFLQEIRGRFPGRGLPNDVETLTGLLKEAEEHHGRYEPRAPKHHWSTWYAGYIDSRRRGGTEVEAVAAATQRVESR